jgi:hypothetical protein
LSSHGGGYFDYSLLVSDAVLLTRDISTMRMETPGPNENFVTIYKTTRCNILEE